MQFQWKIYFYFKKRLDFYITFKLIIYVLSSFLLLVFPISTIFLIFNIKNNSLYNLLMIIIFIYLLARIYVRYQIKYLRPPLLLILSINIFIIMGVTFILLAIFIYKENWNNLTEEFVLSTLGLLITILGVIYTFISDNFVRLEKFKTTNKALEEATIDFLYQFHKKRERLNYKRVVRKKNRRTIYKNKPPQW